MDRNEAILYLSLQDVIIDLKDIDLEAGSREDIARSVKGVIALGEYLLEKHEDLFKGKPDVVDRFILLKEALTQD